MLTKLTFQNKLIIYFFAIALSIIAIFYGFINVFFLDQLKVDTLDRINQLSGKVVQNMDDYVREINHISIRLASDSEIREVLAEKNSDQGTPFTMGRNGCWAVLYLRESDRLSKPLMSIFLTKVWIQSTHMLPLSPAPLCLVN